MPDTLIGRANSAKPRAPARTSGISSRTFFWTVTIAYILFSAAYLAWNLLLLRSEALESGDSTVRAFATVAEDQTGRSIQAIDQTLLLARNLLVGQEYADPAADQSVQRGLGQLTADRPFLRSMRVVNATGRSIFPPATTVDEFATSANRALLQLYRDNADKELEVYLPPQGQTGGQWNLQLARPWRGANGALAGIIVGTPDRDYFARVWTADDFAQGTSVSLFTREGVLLMRSPPLESAIGRSFAQGTIFGKLLPDKPAGTYRNVSTIDNQERLLAYRSISGYPSLIIVVGQTVDHLLTSWRRYAWNASISWAISSVAAAVLIGLLLRLLRTGSQKLDAARLINQKVFETTVDLILVVDRRGNFVQVSPSAMTILGYSPSEMEGRNGTDFVYHEDLESTRNEMRMARSGLVVRNFDCRYVHKDGRVITLAWAGAWSADMQLHFFIGRDMTERQAMEQQLQQAQKMEVVGQLTGGVAHDFNNLLTIILGAAEALSDSLDAQPESKKLNEMVISAALRGADLTKSLLAFSRKQPLQPRVTDVNGLLGGMEGLLRRTLGEGVEINLKCGRTVSPTIIDPTQLESAILNLTVNARDAMDGSGRLTIETGDIVLDEDYARMNPGALPGGYVMIAVADTGAGMSEEVIARAFEPFFTTKEVGKGSGLGLSMVYGFIKQSNGHVKIYSERGHGTTIRLYLPWATSTDAPTSSDLVEAQATGGSETILLVEDDADVREYVEQQVRRLGYNVLSAKNGAEALELLRKVKAVDLLFTDVVMPGGMNGPQLAEAARSIQPAIKVLFTSGYTENAIVHQGRLDIGVDLLSKPYRRSELAAKIRKTLEGRPAVK